MTEMGKRHVAVLLALVVLVALVYWPGLRGGFVFDDFPNILENPNIRVGRLVWDDWLKAALSSPASSLRRPLAMLTFAGNYYFTGFDPWSMKFTNLLVHLLNTLLVFALARNVLGALNTPARGPSRLGDEWAALFQQAGYSGDYYWTILQS